MPEAQAWLIVFAGTSFGMPARMEIWRAGLGPLPACRADPKMVSSICPGSIFARSSAACAAMTPRSGAVMPASEPPNLPMGVRTAERMKTSCNEPSKIQSTRALRALLYTGTMDVIFGIHAVQEAVKSRGRALEYVAFQRERHDA